MKIGIFLLSFMLSLCSAATADEVWIAQDAQGQTPPWRQYLLVHENEIENGIFYYYPISEVYDGDQHRICCELLTPVFVGRLSENGDEWNISDVLETKNRVAGLKYHYEVVRPGLLLRQGTFPIEKGSSSLNVFDGERVRSFTRFDLDSLAAHQALSVLSAAGDGGVSAINCWLRDSKIGPPTGRELVISELARNWRAASLESRGRDEMVYQVAMSVLLGEIELEALAAQREIHSGVESLFRDHSIDSSESIKEFVDWSRAWLPMYSQKLATCDS